MSELWQALLKVSGVLSLALLLLLALRPLMRRLGGVAAQYQFWLLVPAVLLASHLPAPRVEAPAVQRVAVVWSGLQQQSFPVVEPASDSLQRGLLCAWALGVLALFALQWRAQRRLGHGLRPRLGHWVQTGGRGVALLGLLPARVVLPSDFRQRFDAVERRLVLAHERVHARRGDNAWSLLAASLLCLQWFNPMAWWAWQRLRKDQELACDAEVLRRHPKQMRAYTQALMKSQFERPLAGVLLSPCSTHPLIERIAMLRHFSQTSRRALVLSLVGFAALGSYAAQLQPSGNVARPQAADAESVRVLIDLQIDGMTLGTAIHLGSAGQVQKTVLMTPGVGDYEVSSTAEVLGEQRLSVSIELRDLKSGKLLLQGPKMTIPDGLAARLEQAKPGEPVFGIDVIARSPNAARSATQHKGFIPAPR